MIDVRTADGTWDYGSLPANVRLGEDCWLENRLSFQRFLSTRDPGLVLGDRVRVHTWTRFSLEASGLLEVGADSLLVGGLFMGAERITVGEGVVVSYGVTVADCDFHPHDPVLRRRDAVAHSPYGDPADRPAFTTAPVTVDDGAWIGIGALVLKGVTVGAGARVGPGAVVTGDVEPGGAVAGNPARPVDPETEWR